MDALFFLEGNGLFQADRMTMAASLEARVPLLNHDLLTFINHLPFKVKARRGKMKQRNPKLIDVLLAFWRTGMTQYQFAESVGLGYSVFNQILNGRIHPREDEKKKIAEGLGVQVDEIFSRGL